MTQKNSVLLAVIILVGYGILFSLSGVILQPDSGTYLTPAQNLLHSHAFLNAAGEPEVIRTPVYPLLIAFLQALGLGNGSLVFVQILLVLISALWIYQFVLEQTERSGIAFLCALLFAFNPNVVEHAFSVLTDLPFALGILLLFAILYRLPRSLEVNTAVSLGILLGVLTLLRPAGMFLPFLLLPYFFWRHGKAALRFSVVFILASNLLPLGWALRNQKEVGVFQISTITTINQLRYTAAGLVAIQKPGSFAANFLPAQLELQAQADKAIEERYGKKLDEIPLADRLKTYDTFSSQVIREHFFEIPAFYLRNLIYTFFAGNVDFLIQITTIPLNWMSKLVFLYTLPGFLLVLFGFGILFTRNRELFWLSLILVAYPILISATSAGAGVRFRLPATPLTSFILAFAFAYGWSAKKVSLPSIHKEID